MTVGKGRVDNAKGADVCASLLVSPVSSTEDQGLCKPQTEPRYITYWFFWTLFRSLTLALQLTILVQQTELVAFGPWRLILAENPETHFCKLLIIINQCCQSSKIMNLNTPCNILWDELIQTLLLSFFSFFFMLTFRFFLVHTRTLTVHLRFLTTQKHLLAPPLLFLFFCICFAVLFCFVENCPKNTKGLFVCFFHPQLIFLRAGKLVWSRLVGAIKPMRY